MKQHLNHLRPATAALFAALVLPTAPVFAQTPQPASPPPVIAAPPPVATPTPAPITVAPPPPTVSLTPRPAPVATPAPATQTRTATPRPAPRAQAPARTATRTPAPAARVPAPAATPAPTAPAPVAQAPAETLPPPAPIESAPVAPVEAAPVETQTESTASLLPWIIGGIAVLALLAGFFLFRRRRTEEVYEEAYEPAPPRAAADEPTFVAPLDVAPVAAEPVFIRPFADPVPEPRAVTQPVADEPTAVPPPEEIAVAEADHADVEALAASSEPVAGRPWLEFLMRPMRAGTNRDNAIVQFELTVGNTGDVPARDVRISTWVVAAGEGTDYERSLIDPPADAAVERVSIDAGEGATVEAKIGLAKEGLDESVLPVVVADARYTLPDGSEGRTHASFAVGVPAAESGELEPFLTDRSSGLRENVEARLYGEPERV
ncbi:MAG TPA: hypothetical protein VMG08_13860 [Allosphingosinicella sp.]|nr:hypothetical protein [Allosphingosinicella sp.]